MSKIIDGKLVSRIYREQIKNNVDQFVLKTGIKPGLAVIIVGSEPASKIYVRNKKRACEEVGIESFEIVLPENISEEELICEIDRLNKNDSIHGILVQLPLPSHIIADNVISAISVDKDVDCFHPYNVGKIMLGNSVFSPCTPAGIVELLDFYNIDISGKNCVIIGRSNIVGKPMSMLMLNKNATVTVCHSKTIDLESEISSADILVSAVGMPEFIKGHMIKENAVVIDVGINRTESGTIVGDIHFDSVHETASMITPVPGGVGPMTVTMLLKNTLIAAQKKHINNKF